MAETMVVHVGLDHNHGAFLSAFARGVRETDLQHVATLNIQSRKLCLTGVKQRHILPWMGRPRHPNKHIEAVVRYAESLGWRVELSNGHAWGHLLCPHAARGGCIWPVYSTPRVPEKHARQLRRQIDSCPHQGEEDEDDA
jgi:hypothetical protein